MNEKPLHVRVAEALGYACQPCDYGPSAKPHGCGCWRYSAGCSPPHVDQFDTDWAATGPLIERFGIGVHLSQKPMDPPMRGETWIAGTWRGSRDSFSDSTKPLVAVCNLIIALAEAGKLK